MWEYEEEWDQETIRSESSFKIDTKTEVLLNVTKWLKALSPGLKYPKIVTVFCNIFFESQKINVEQIPTQDL